MKFLRRLFSFNDPPPEKPSDQSPRIETVQRPIEKPSDVVIQANKMAEEVIERHRQRMRDAGVPVHEYIAYDPAGFAPLQPVKWMLSENGNKFFEHAGKRVTIYQDMRGSRTLWKFCSADEEGPEEPFFSDHYFTEDDAATDALRFHFIRPIKNNTYQAQRDSEVREAVPGLIAAERKRLSDLLERVERGRSKKSNLLKDAQKRLQQTEHLHHVALMADTQDAALLAATTEVAAHYRKVIKRINALPG